MSHSPAPENWRPKAGRHTVQPGPSLLQALGVQGSPEPVDDFYSFKCKYAIYYLRAIIHQFKPGSDDSTRPGKIGFMQHKPDGKTAFKMERTNAQNERHLFNVQQQVKEWECVLIYDEETDTFSLERLESHMHITYDRSGTRAAREAGASVAAPSPPTTASTALGGRKHAPTNPSSPAPVAMVPEATEINHGEEEEEEEEEEEQPLVSVPVPRQTVPSPRKAVVHPKKSLAKLDQETPEMEELLEISDPVPLASASKSRPRPKISKPDKTQPREIISLGTLNAPKSKINGPLSLPTSAAVSPSKVPAPVPPFPSTPTQFSQPNGEDEDEDEDDDMEEAIVTQNQPGQPPPHLASMYEHDSGSDSDSDQPEEEDFDFLADALGQDDPAPVPIALPPTSTPALVPPAGGKKIMSLNRLAGGQEDDDESSSDDSE